MTDVVGSAAFELRAVREKLKKDLKDAEGDLKNFGDNAERDLGSSGSRIGAGIGGFVSKATVAVTAFAAVLSVAVLGVVRLGQASLDMAENIADTARRVNVSTEALQEFRQVARQTGEDAAAADQALTGFNKKLAEAASGLNKGALESFAAIGIDQAQLRSFKDTEEALDLVVERIGDLSSEADRAAIAEKLGLGPLATALSQGSDEVARLRDEAREMGFVIDDALIQRGAEAAQRMDDLSQIIGIQLSGAFLSLSDEIVTFTGNIADALEGLNRFIDRFQGWRERANIVYGEGAVNSFLRGNPQPLAQAAGNALFSGRAQDVQRAYATPVFDQDDPALISQQMALDARNERPQSGGSSRLILPPPRTRTPRAPRDTSAQDAKRAAELEQRRTERFQSDLDRARQRLLGLAEDQADTAQGQFDALQDSLTLERQIRDADLERQVIEGDLTEARRAILAAANAEADALEDRVVADRAFREIDAERLATERLLSGLASDLLSLQSGGARTAAERRRIELELLEISQRERRDALNRELDRTNAKASVRQEALGSLGSIEMAERGSVLRGTLSPLDQWRDESLRSADEIREAYENVAARGLDALNDGIVDAIVNSQNLGDVFSNVAKQILADLASIAVRRSITEPLANLLFGGGESGGASSGGGNFLTSALSFGSRLLGGQSGGTDQGGGLFAKLLGSPVSPIAGPSASMFGTAKAPAGLLSQAPIVKLFIDEGGMFKARVEQISGPIAVQAGQAGARAGSGMAQAEIAKRSRYRTR